MSMLLDWDICTSAIKIFNHRLIQNVISFVSNIAQSQKSRRSSKSYLIMHKYHILSTLSFTSNTPKCKCSELPIPDAHLPLFKWTYPKTDSSKKNHCSPRGWKDLGYYPVERLLSCCRIYHIIGWGPSRCFCTISCIAWPCSWMCIKFVSSSRFAWRSWVTTHVRQQLWDTY